jgi:hypothetical protein
MFKNHGHTNYGYVEKMVETIHSSRDNILNDLSFKRTMKERLAYFLAGSSTWATNLPHTPMSMRRTLHSPNALYPH